jgi:hypothetical protein
VAQLASIWWRSSKSGLKSSGASGIESGIGIAASLSLQRRHGIEKRNVGGVK